jgi:hypothetical protein
MSARSAEGDHSVWRAGMTDTPVRGVQPPPHPGLQVLEPLVGDWDVEPIVEGRSIGIGAGPVRVDGVKRVPGPALGCRGSGRRATGVASQLAPTTCIIGLDDPSVARESAGILELELDARVTVQRDDDGHAVV